MTLELKSRDRSTLGRYEDVHAAQTPGALPREGQRAGGKIAIRHAAVPDPNPTLRGKRQRVAVNIHASALEAERAYGRISEAGYRAGQVYEAIVEAACGQRSGGGSGEAIDRGSVIVRQLMAIVAGIDRAARAVELQDEVRSAIGRDGEFILRLVLGEGRTFGEIAESHGFTSAWARRRVAAEFRQAIEALAVHWSKTRTPRA